MPFVFGWMRVRVCVPQPGAGPGGLSSVEHYVEHDLITLHSWFLRKR
jgi:hypothetical protein